MAVTQKLPLAGLLAAMACAPLAVMPSSAHADDFSWDARGNPIQVCYAVQRTVRFAYNARTNGSIDTYEDIRSHMRKQLEGKGEPEAKLREVYEASFKRIDSNEFSPPKMERGEGQIAARNAAGALCLKSFPPPAPGR